MQIPLSRRRDEREARARADDAEARITNTYQSLQVGRNEVKVKVVLKDKDKRGF